MGVVGVVVGGKVLDGVDGRDVVERVGEVNLRLEDYEDVMDWNMVGF